MQAAGTQQDKYLSSITSYVTQQRPAPLRGGILADDMGLGKTLIVLALLASNRPGEHFTELPEPSMLAQLRIRNFHSTAQHSAAQSSLSAHLSHV